MSKISGNAGSSGTAKKLVKLSSVSQCQTLSGTMKNVNVTCQFLTIPNSNDDTLTVTQIKFELSEPLPVDLTCLAKIMLSNKDQYYTTSGSYVGFSGRILPGNTSITANRTESGLSYCQFMSTNNSVPMSSKVTTFKLPKATSAMTAGISLDPVNITNASEIIATSAITVGVVTSWDYQSGAIEEQ